MSLSPDRRSGLRLLRRAFGLLLLANLAACAQLGLDTPAKPAAKTSDTTVAKKTPPAQQSARVTPEKTPAYRAPKLLDLTGLRPGHMRALLGEPAVRRLDPPAQHWRYDGPDCSLHVFFLRGAKNYQVTHIDARAPRSAGQKTLPAEVERDLCIDQVWRNGPVHRSTGAS